MLEFMLRAYAAVGLADMTHIALICLFRSCRTARGRSRKLLNPLERSLSLG